VLVAISTAIVLVVFDWTLRVLATGVPIGIAVFGAGWYFSLVRQQVPAGPLEAPPASAGLQNRSDKPRWPFTALLWAVPLCLGLAWFIDAVFDRSAALFLPGQFAGTAAAYLTGAARVSRWERRHGAVVVASASPLDEEIYAVPRA